MHEEPKLTLDASAFLEYRCRVAKERREKSGQKEFITVTRQAGAAGPGFFDMLRAELVARDADRQNWMVFEKNLIEKVLDEHHMPSRIAQYLSEATDSEIHDMMEELFGLHPARWALVRKTSQTILHLAQLGHAIIVGRAGNFVTRKLGGGLHVQLIAPLESRVKRIRDFYRIDAAKAAAFVHEEDAEKKAYMKKYFDRDINDPSLYDLVINTDVLCYEDAVQAIVGITTNRPPQQTTG